jgi:hypothetical protein
MSSERITSLKVKRESRNGVPCYISREIMSHSVVA